MRQLTWINILHIYQPPTQTKKIVDLVVRESYSKLIELLDMYPQLALTMNITGSLVELLEKYGHAGIIAGLKKHVEAGRIELVGSAVYHPILPLLSDKEIERQVTLNTDILKRHFGDRIALKGFYFPEMAYSTQAARVVKGMGFEWVILDEIHARGPVSPAVRYVIQDVGMQALFRNNRFSKTFPPEYVPQHREELDTEYLITAHDGELYGHWHKDDKGYYEQTFTHPDIAFVTGSQYLQHLTESKEVEVREANWESTHEELAQDITFGLWKHPQNQIHAKLETLKNAVLEMVEGHAGDPGYARARSFADKGVASCAWWWASERKLGPFSPVTWNPEEIEKGARELLAAAQSLETLPQEAREKIEMMFSDLHEYVWAKHWREHPHKT